jgi:kumamolisin
MDRHNARKCSAGALWVAAVSSLAVLSACNGSDSTSAPSGGGTTVAAPGAPAGSVTVACAQSIARASALNGGAVSKPVTADRGSFMPGKAASSSAEASPQKLHGHVIAAQANSKDLGLAADAEVIPVTVSLGSTDDLQLENDVAAIYTPGSPTYHQFITPAEFKSRYAPSAEQAKAVAAYLQSQGLTGVSVDASGMSVHAKGVASSLGNAFGTEIHSYTSATGTSYRAPAYELQVPAGLKIAAVLGLQNLTKRHGHAVKLTTQPAHPLAGTGEGGGYSASDIRKAYNVPEGAGAGQTLALFELDGYDASDITAYESQNSLPAVSLQNVIVDGEAGSSDAEVALDIELTMALAPNVSKILVYEGPNSESGMIDTYQQIATDNLAATVSTSWGSSESGSGSSLLQSENTIFMQMAAQGQSIFAAAGDSGAYDDGSTLSVDDPSSQPFMTAAGGTTLSTNADGSYAAESSWNEGSGAAGGGGISSSWSIPSWQAGVGVGTSANLGSTTMRNTPDISLHADESTGYAIYFDGSWGVWGGTSCAAPLWAAFTSVVNEARLSAGLGYIGFVNPTLYALGRSSGYSHDFHDINDGSTNLYYPAVTGYDNSTGWGSFNGQNLITDLVAYDSTDGTTLGSTGVSCAAK